MDTHSEDKMSFKSSFIRGDAGRVEDLILQHILVASFGLAFRIKIVDGLQTLQLYYYYYYSYQSFIKVV